MRYPQDELENFEFLCQSKPEKLNQLSYIADSLGVSFDDKRWDDAPRKGNINVEVEYDNGEADKLLATYL